MTLTPEIARAAEKQIKQRLATPKCKHLKSTVTITDIAAELTCNDCGLRAVTTPQQAEAWGWTG
jgi:hypothetical protein